MTMSSRISQFEKDAEERLQQIPDWCSTAVQEQPMTALGTVFAFGFLVGAAAITLTMASPPPPSRRWPTAGELGNRISDGVSRAMPRQMSDLWSR